MYYFKIERNPTLCDLTTKIPKLGLTQLQAHPDDQETKPGSGLVNYCLTALAVGHVITYNVETASF